MRRIARAAAGAVAVLAAAACAVPPAPKGASVAETVDSLARDYVLLSLTIGEKEAGYIDAYYGPPELAAQAKTDATTADLGTLRARAEALRAAIAAHAPADGASIEAQRVRFLEAQLTAAITRLRMMQGEKLSFVEEAQGLFGVTPQLVDLSTLDPVLERIEALVPGKGSLADRVDAFQSKLDIPSAQVLPALQAGIAECKRRTLPRIPLPEGERFELSLVTNKPWGGYNWYQGGYHSLIQINTDLPVSLARVIDLGCHEGYPGHHVYNALLERDLVKGRGWIEFTVYPLYSPQSLIAEGSANYGIDLAFPGDDAATFNREVLAPIAHLPKDAIAPYAALQKAKEALSGARYTIAAQYLDGTIDEAEAVRLTRKYTLTSEAKARKSLEFDRAYRSYVINYGLGQEMVRHAVEAAGPSAYARWARMTTILSTPTLPADLVAMAGR